MFQTYAVFLRAHFEVRVAVSQVCCLLHHITSPALSLLVQTHKCLYDWPLLCRFLFTLIPDKMPHPVCDCLQMFLSKTAQLPNDDANPEEGDAAQASTHVR